MRRFTLFMLLLIAVSLDCSVLAKIHLWDLQLSLSLGIIVCIAVIYGKLSGALSGLVVGLIMDLMFAPAFGLYAMVNLLTGYMAGAMFSKGMRDDPLLVGMLVAGMFVVRECILIMFSLMLGATIINVFVLFIRYLLPSALLCGMLGGALYIALRPFFTTGYMRRRRLGLD